MFDNLGVSLALAQAGKLKLLAVASPKRMASLPDTPALAELLPGFEAVAWYGIVAPPGTPKAIVDKINADVNEALRHPMCRRASNRCRPRFSAARWRRPRPTCARKSSAGAR